MGGDDGGGDALPSRESSVRVSEHEHEREREHERTGMAERESARARRARRVRAVARTMLGDGCGAVGGVGGSMAAARGRVVFLLERTHADQSACARRERRVRAAARTMLEEEIAAREQLPAGPPQHVGPAGGARGHRKAAQHLHDLQLWMEGNGAVQPVHRVASPQTRRHVVQLPPKRRVPRAASPC